MFFVPTWVTNLLFLGTVYLSIFQHVRLRHPNPVTNLQFVMIAFSLLMMIFNTLYNRANPWLSVSFAVTAVVCLIVMIRQMRMLPPLDSVQ